VDLDEPEHAHIADAVRPYQEKFKQLPDGMCLYFEACGPSIGRRFSHLEAHPVRVFDVSSEGGADFLPFTETIRICAELGFPLVHFTEHTLDLASLCAMLSAKPCPRYHDMDAQLEGFVVRDTTAQGRIAKIRVDDMVKLVTR
jgi:hypothetical protein